MRAVLFDRVAALRQAPLFRHLSEAELCELGQHAALRRLRRNDLLVVEGEPAKGLFVLIEGQVRVFREGPDGREQVIRVEVPVSTLNESQLFDQCQHPASMCASQDASILFVPLAESRALIHCNPRASKEALQLLASRLHNALDLIDSLALLSVDQRIAQFLLAEARRRRSRFNQDLRAELTLSNHQLGAMVGAVREVVSRSLCKLSKLGLVACEGRTFTIPDEERLEAFIEGRSAMPIRRRAASC